MVLIQSVPSEIRQLDMNILRLDLKDMEDDEQGIVWLDTHSHNPPVTVSGAILARVVQFINNYTVTFEDGQYRASVVGANTNIGEVTNVNQVSVSTSNSAGLQDLNSLQAASFNGEVAVDVNSIYDGTVFPVGTRAYPVNNIADADLIGDERGLNVFIVMSSMTISSGDFSDAHTFKGVNPSSVVITVEAASNVTNCQFENTTIQGVLDNDNIIRDCALEDIDHISGSIHTSALFGTITIGGSAQATIVDCVSGIAGGGPGAYPTIDMGGSGNQLALRGYSGGLGIANSTGTAQSSLDFDSGRVVFESSCTGGDFTVRGICDVDDNSAGATINDLTLNLRIEEATLVQELSTEQAAAEHTTDPILGKVILRNTVTLRRWEADAWEDAAQTIPYRGRIDGIDESGGLESVGQLIEVAWS